MHLFNKRIVPLTETHVLKNVRRYLDVGRADGIRIQILPLYLSAVSHDSYVHTDPRQRVALNERCPKGFLPIQESTYERLEFLGDAILSAVVTSYLYKRYAKKENEGFMTRMRTHLINGRMLADLCARGTTLVQHIAVSKSFEDQHRKKQEQEEGREVSIFAEAVAFPKQQQQQRAGSRRHRRCHRRHLPYRILEDVFEAFLGAMYLDQGYDLTAAWIVACLETNVDFAELAARKDTPRAVLNRHCQTKLGYLPEVESIGETTARVVHPESRQVLATGQGLDRRDAESRAIDAALAYLGVSIYGGALNQM